MQQLPKSLFVFGFCVPLAIVFGFMLATPLDQNTMFLVLGGMLLLLTPLLLKAHHSILILSWNAYVNAFFLPGQPYFWMLMTAVSVGLIILTSTLNRGKLKYLSVPSVGRPLILLFVVAACTAYFTGGVGARALGSESWGGKRYLFLFAGIVGYFAISLIPVEGKSRQRLAAGFFLIGMTAITSNLAYMLGERFYYFFLLFPAEWAITQAAADATVGGFTRIGGLAPASLALLSWALLRYGLRGCIDTRKPWRMLFVIASFVACLFSGFRSTFVLMLIIAFVQFFVEGLHRTKYMLVFTFAFLMLAGGVVLFAEKLPLAVQRCLTIFPLDLDRTAIEQAKNSTDWRLDMWRALLPDIPKYLWLGKGYTLDPKDMYFSQAHISRRIDSPYEQSLVAGDYHSGPLTLLIPFGIWGVIAFVWFYIAGFNVLRRNLKYGDPEIRNINHFLFCYYIARMIFFITIFGAFYMDLAAFIGVVALSISVNHGLASPARATQPVAEPVPVTPPVRGLAWQPAFRRA